MPIDYTKDAFEFIEMIVNLCEFIGILWFLVRVYIKIFQYDIFSFLAEKKINDISLSKENFLF